MIVMIILIAFIQMNTRLPKKMELQLLVEFEKSLLIRQAYRLQPCYRAKKIIEEWPELVKDKVRSGSATINKAYSQLQKQEKRKSLLLANASGLSFPEGVKLIQGDFVENSNDIPDNSIDLIFTDLPYGEEYLHLYKSLLEVAP